MKKNTIICIAFCLAWLMPCQALAANPDGGLQLKARVGYNIGGTAPIGLPATIRSIEAYRLTPSVMAGADLQIPLHGNWGIMAGLRVENKAMDADVTTKAYHMEVVKNESKIEGLFTGHIRQEVTEWMLTLPVMATYQLGQKVSLKAGLYLSLLLGKDFSGIASDGYLRQGTPTGPKVYMGNKEGEWSTYDFSDDMRSLQFGVTAGADWQLHEHFGLSADLNWGLTGIFKNNFETIEQSLYPLYGTIGLFWKF